MSDSKSSELFYGVLIVIMFLLSMIVVGGFYDNMYWARHQVNKLNDQVSELQRGLLNQTHKQKKDNEDVLERVRHLERKKKRTLVE